MVLVTLFSIESKEKSPWSEMPVLLIPSNSRAFADMFLTEFSFQKLFWSFLIELNVFKPQKP